MKKGFVCFLLLSLICIKSTSAQRTIIKLNSIIDADSISLIHFAYPTFRHGRVFFVNKGITPAKLNYNRATDEILFQNKDIILALNKLETVEKITIANDTFLVSPVGGFVKQIAAYPTITLVKKSQLKLSDREKKGAYGGYSSVAGAQSVTTMPGDDRMETRVGVDENLSFTLTDTYYLLTPSKKLIEANEKAFVLTYPDYKKELQTYFGRTKVDFNSEEDLNRLLLFAQSFK